MGKIKLRIKKLDLKERVQLLNKLANIGNEYVIVPVIVSVSISLLLSLLIYGVPEVKEDYIKILMSVWECFISVGSATFILSFAFYSFRVLSELDVACAGSIGKGDIMKYISIHIIGLIVTLNILRIDNTLLLKVIGALSIISYILLKVMVIRLRKEVLYN